MPGQDLVGVKEGVEVQVVPRQCKPGSAAEETPSTELRGVSEEAGAAQLTFFALAPIPAAPFLAALAALFLAFLGPVSPVSPVLVSPAPGNPDFLVSLSPAAPGPVTPSPAFLFLTSPPPISPFSFFRPPAFPAPAPVVFAVLLVAFEFPILLVMGHSELGQVAVNFV